MALPGYSNSSIIPLSPGEGSSWEVGIGMTPGIGSMQGIEGIRAAQAAIDSIMAQYGMLPEGLPDWVYDMAGGLGQSGGPEMQEQDYGRPVNIVKRNEAGEEIGIVPGVRIGIGENSRVVTLDDLASINETRRRSGQAKIMVGTPGFLPEYVDESGAVLNRDSGDPQPPAGSESTSQRRTPGGIYDDPSLQDGDGTSIADGGGGGGTGPQLETVGSVSDLPDASQGVQVLGGGAGGGMRRVVVGGKEFFIPEWVGNLGGYLKSLGANAGLVSAVENIQTERQKQVQQTREQEIADYRNQRIQEVEQEIEQLRQQDLAELNEIEKQRLEELDSEFSELREQRLQDLNSQIEERKGQELKNLESQIASEEDKRRRDLNTELENERNRREAQLESEIANLSETQKQEARQSLARDMAREKEQKLAELDADIKSQRETRMSDLESDINQKYSELSSELEAARETRFSDLDADYESKLSEYNTQVQNLEEQLSGLTTQQTALQESITGLESELTGLEGQESAFEQSIYDLTGQQAALQESITGLTGQEGALQESITGLTGQQSDLQKQIQQLTEQYTQMADGTGTGTGTGTGAGTGDASGQQGMSTEELLQFFTQLSAVPAFQSGTPFQEGEVPGIYPTAIGSLPQATAFIQSMLELDRAVSPQQAETALDLYSQITGGVREAQSPLMQSLARRSEQLGAQAERLMGPLSFLEQRGATQAGYGQAAALGREIDPLLREQQAGRLREEQRNINLQLAGQLLGQQRATAGLMADIESGIYGRMAPDIGVDPGQILGIAGTDIQNILGERIARQAAEAERESGRRSQQAKLLQTGISLIPKNPLQAIKDLF